MSQKLSAEEWSRYWQKASLTTFQGSFEGNYDGEIRSFWESQLSLLPADARIVDLATGNGALAVLMSEFSMQRELEFRITAIDFAAIDPTGRVRASLNSDIVRHISFISDTPIENTGLPNNSFDCAVSQFGFEYSDTAKSLDELNRMLKPHSWIFFMMHHEDSAVLEQAREGLQQARVCLSSGLHPMLSEFLKHLNVLRQKGRDSSPKAEKLRNDINAITGSLHSEMDKHRDPGQLEFFLRYSMATLGKQFAGRPLEEKLLVLEQVEKETLGYERRMKDLVAAGMSDRNIVDVHAALQAHGFVVDRSETLRYKGRHFGYTLAAAR